MVPVNSNQIQSITSLKVDNKIARRGKSPNMKLSMLPPGSARREAAPSGDTKVIPLQARLQLIGVILPARYQGINFQ